MVISCALACSRMSMLKPNLRCLVTLPTPISIVPMEIGVLLAESTSASWEEVFQTMPAPVRKILQEEIAQLRYAWSETIWRDVFRTWVRGLREIVGVPFNGIAVTGLRFLIEMRGLKGMGGKILHIEAAGHQRARGDARPSLRDRAGVARDGDYS